MVFEKATMQAIGALRACTYYDPNALLHPLKTIQHLFSPEWTPDMIGDLSGKVALVTGGNSGLGYEICRRLALSNARVLMVSRIREKGETSAQSIREEYRKANVQVLQCDLSSLRNTLALVEEVKAMTGPLHLLVNNAGKFIEHPYAQTSEGFEDQLVTDYYSAALLSLGLLDKLVDSGPGSRIVMEASIAEVFASFDWDNLKGDKYAQDKYEKIKASGLVQYGNAKLFMIMFGKELQDRIDAGVVTAGKPRVDVYAAHPGVVDTPLQQKVDPGTYPSAIPILFQARTMGLTAPTGAYPALMAATRPDLKGFQYIAYNPLNLFPAPRKPAHPAANIPAARARLFNETVRILEDTIGAEKMPHPRDIKLIQL